MIQSNPYSPPEADNHSNPRIGRHLFFALCCTVSLVYAVFIFGFISEANRVVTEYGWGHLRIQGRAAELTVFSACVLSLLSCWAVGISFLHRKQRLCVFWMCTLAVGTIVIFAIPF